jgi:putative isomerase
MTPHQWWTWNSERPVELIHLASGLKITPVLYSASKERISLLNPGPEISFGRRPVGDELIQFTTEVARTVLQWEYDIRDGDFAIHWKVLRYGEWGLRFWVNLCLTATEDAKFIFDRETGRVSGTGSHENFVLTSEKKTSVGHATQRS